MYYVYCILYTVYCILYTDLLYSFLTRADSCEGRIADVRMKQYDNVRRIANSVRKFTIYAMEGKV